MVENSNSEKSIKNYSIFKRVNSSYKKLGIIKLYLPILILIWLIAIIIQADLTRELAILDKVFFVIQDVFLILTLSFLIYVFTYFITKRIIKNLDKISELLLNPFLKRILISKQTVRDYFQILGLFTVTLTILISDTTGLIVALFSRSFEPILLIKDAGLLWVMNLLMFTTLYWIADAGGPIIRKSQTNKFEPENFVFPEASLNAGWKPNFLDYLFLAFNFSTSFSVTDSNVITRSAKVCVMFQILISMVAVVVIAARAINILTIPS